MYNAKPHRQLSSTALVLIIVFSILLSVISLPALWLGFIIFHGNTHHTYEYLYPADQIASIQFVHMQTDTDLYQYSVDEIPSLLDDRQILCMVLDMESHDTFLSDFSEVPCHKWVNDPIPKISGRVIVITYNDGSREWISSDGTFYYDVSSSDASMTWFYFDDEAFDSLLSLYGC